MVLPPSINIDHLNVGYIVFGVRMFHIEWGGTILHTSPTTMETAMM